MLSSEPAEILSSDEIGLLPANVHDFPLRAGEYYGQVGTNCWISHAEAAEGLISYFGYQRHIIRSDVTEIAVRFANWYVDRKSKTEYFVKCPTNFTMSVEYPLGTLHQLTFNRVSQGWATVGGDICSDFLPIDIPAGAEIWIRVTTYSMAPWPRQMTRQNPVVRSGGAYGSQRMPDLTMAAEGVTLKPRSSGIWPIGIIARTSHGGVLGIGDSIMQGTGDTPDESDNVGLVGRAACDTHAFINAGFAGDALGNFLESYDKRLSLARYVKNIVFEHGVNGLADTDLVTLKGQMLAAWNLGVRYKRPGSRLFQTTITPSTISTDNFATVDNQKYQYGFGKGRREVLNDWLRDGAPIADGKPVAAGLSGVSRAGDGSHPLHAVFDVAAAVESERNSGKWKANGTPNWITSDGLHPNQNGYLMFKHSGAIDVSKFA